MKYNDVTLGQVEAVWNKLGGEEGVQRFLAGETVVAEAQKPPLLKFLDTIQVSANVGKFVVADHYKKDNADGVAISVIWEDFQSLCGNVIEEPTAATTLRRHSLLRAELDKPIIAELGGESAVATTFFAIWERLKLQKNGANGKLLTDGSANIFYVYVTGVLLAVCVLWYDDGWYVDAYSVGSPHGWSAGRQVFSSNSGNLAA